MRREQRRAVGRAQPRRVLEVLDGQRQPVQDTPRGRRVGFVGHAQRDLGLDQRDDRVHPRIHVGDPRQVRLHHLTRRELPGSQARGELRRGTAPHAATPYCADAMGDFVHELRVRYGECDPQGIVFNPNYLAYFDHTVTELWRASAIGSWEAMVERGIDVVVGEANVRFRSPARFDDLIALHARIAKFGTTSLTLEIEILRDQELLVEGWLRQVFVDARTWQKTEIPDWVRDALAVYA